MVRIWKVTWIPWIIVSIIWSMFFVFMLIYCYIELEIMVAIVLTPFILMTIYALLINSWIEYWKLIKKKR